MVFTTLGGLHFDQKMNGTVHLCESSSRINAPSGTSTKPSVFCEYDVKASKPLPLREAHPATGFLMNCLKTYVLKMTTLSSINKLTASLFFTKNWENAWVNTALT